LKGSALRTIVIVPAFNEQQSIVSTIAGLTSMGLDYVVVNDGSTDNTLAVCREHGISTINLPVNLGIGGAVQTGFRFAVDNGYETAVQFDGDGQHEASSIPSLLAGLDHDADLVVGSRFVDNTETFKSTAMRRLGIRWLSALIRLITGVRIRDVTSGFRVYGTRALELFALNYPIDYPEPESLVFALNHGLNILELPAKMHPRQGGKSSIRAFSSIYYMIKVTLSVMIVRIAGRRG
jgi:glycosyltransferase involved in cell wall biosynthesis